MKKVLFLFIVLTFTLLNVDAQGTGYWDLNGNNNAGSSNFIGTLGNQPLIFKTRGDEQMRLLPGIAFLGIGVSTPLATLHLHNPQIGGLIPLLRLTTDATGNAANNGFAVFSDYTTKEIRFKQQESAKFFLEGPNGGFVVAPDGNIGYNTPDPQQKVHINEGNLLISSVNSGSTNDPVGALLFDDFSTSPWCIEYPGSSGLNFRQYNPFTFPGAENSVLFLSNYQRVGIGTRSPQQKLHVKNGNLLITGPSKSTGIEENAIIFKLEDVVMPSPAPSRWGIERIELGGRNCGLNFWKYGKTKIGADYRSVMFFNDNDFVGIGTESPQAKLDIAGDFRAESAEITGTLTADELSVQNINIGEKLGIGVTGTLLTTFKIRCGWLI